MKKKELLAAAIVKDYRFINPDELEIYLNELDHKKIRYEVLEKYITKAGPVLVRIAVGYNSSPLIQLYED